MGCPNQGILGEELVFTITCRDATGAPSDADGAVSYSVYEDETDTAILTGSMSLLDDAGTTGFYSEAISLTAANGFERFKSYAVRITCDIDGISVAKGYSFICIGASDTAVVSGSGKSLSDLKTMCQYYGWTDFTTEGEAELVNFINDTFQILATLAPWPEYHKRDGAVTFAADDDDMELSETNICRVGTVIRTDRAAPLEEFSDGMEGWLFNKKYHAGEGPPTHYALRKYTTSGNLKAEMLVYPCPAVSTTLYFTYQMYPSVLSSDSDKTDWPNIRMFLVSKALHIRLAAVDRDAAGMALYGTDFMAMVNRAYNQARPSMKPIVAKQAVFGKPTTPLLHIEKTFVT